MSNECIAVRKVATLLQELTCHMGSHSVTCHPAELTFPPLPQPKLVLSDPGGMQGWVDLVVVTVVRNRHRQTTDHWPHPPHLCSVCASDAYDMLFKRALKSSRGPVWARGRCRIRPPRFLAECCKRQMNKVSFVSLYFRLSTFSDLYWVCLSVFFLYCFVCQYRSSDWLWRPPPKWPKLCRVGC